MVVHVNFTQKIGSIKPLHGIGNAPLIGTSDSLFHYLGEAGIPYSRLHDTGGRFGGGCFVDINNVFRDFSKDPEDPNSYDFAFTDWLISELVKQGVRPFYRLGTTIENSHMIKAYYIYPPEDNVKWAKICEGIIRHYNHGWADGFNYDIKYWEIWNEPDNEPDVRDNPMWKGSMEDYFKLYEVTANYLKQKFPDLLIGGFASCGFYALSETIAGNANSSTRTGYFIHFFNEFLKYITSDEHRSPLDFFSWHSYAGPVENVMYAKYAREILDSFGFHNTESILNEWNPGIAFRGKSKDAANIAAMFCALQGTSVDKAMYYDGQVNTSYGGMFDPVNETIFKAYYAFYMFNILYSLGNEVKCSCNEDGVYTLAAANDTSGAVLLANPTAKEYELSLSVVSPCEEYKTETYVVDEKSDYTKVETTVISPESITLIKYTW